MTTTCHIPIASLALACLLANPSLSAEVSAPPPGTLRTSQGYSILSVKGTPEQMGEAHGRLLKPVIQKIVKALVAEGVDNNPALHTNLLAAGRVMQPFQPEEYRRELKALAKAAAVPEDDLFLLQCYDDIKRCARSMPPAQRCTSFAITQPLTAGNTCIVGRNLDYVDHGAANYASILMYAEPEGKIPFVTVTWAGVINGWSLLNTNGIFLSNDTLAGERSKSLEGMSTSFLMRYIVERATSVDDAIRLAREARRTCGTGMLIASGNPPDAAILEFDASGFEVRRLAGGFVGVANSFLKLNQDKPRPYRDRIARAYELAQKFKGRVDLRTPIAEDDGVPLKAMNLHCITLDLAALRFRLAMGSPPAYKLPFKTFQLTAEGLSP